MLTNNNRFVITQRFSICGMRTHVGTRKNTANIKKNLNLIYFLWFVLKTSVIIFYILQCNNKENQKIKISKLVGWVGTRISSKRSRGRYVNKRRLGNVLANNLTNFRNLLWPMKFKPYFKFWTNSMVCWTKPIMYI